MKCPKCGYISFDSNDNCPRCRKDMAAERHRLNLPDFTPNPPYLLGLLNGESGSKKIGLETDQMAPPTLLEPEHLVGPEDSQALHAIEMAFEADHETPTALESPAMQVEEHDASVQAIQDLELEKDSEEIDFLELSLEDLEPPTSLTVESVSPDDEVEVDVSSAASNLKDDELEDLEDDLLFGEDEASLDDALGQIPDPASGLVFLDEDAALDEALEGPLDLDQLASMVESINEDATPPSEKPKQPFDPSLGVEHLMEDELPGPDVTLGRRSDKE